jgi:hypothetical protein
MKTLKKSKHKTKKNDVLKPSKNSQKTNKTNKINKIKTSKQSNQSITQNRTQYGSGVFNTMSGLVFTNTKKTDYSVSLPGSQLLSTSKQQLKNIMTKKNTSISFFKIIYNYRTPKEHTIEKNTITPLYQSSAVFTVPHIHINHIKHFLIVMILPGVKPSLLWAIDFKNGSKLKTIIDYSLPKFAIDYKFKLVFNIYKYPDNTINSFRLKNSMIMKRKKAYRKFKKYLIKKNMEKSLIGTKTIEVIQDKGFDINNILKKVVKYKKV